MFSKVRKQEVIALLIPMKRSMIFQLAPFETKTDEKPARTKSLRHSAKKPGRISAENLLLETRHPPKDVPGRRHATMFSDNI